MTRALWRLAEIGLLLLVGFGLATLAGILLYDPPDRSDYAAIVVLSHGAFPDGGLTDQTEARTRAGIALYEAGRAPMLVMSGGQADTDPAPKAVLMAELARTEGVADAALLVEDASHSTLQNALFTARLAPDLQEAPILLVTHRYHGARSIASFWWAGFDDIHFAAADPQDPVWPGSQWEPIKWAGNVVRAAGYSVARAVGVDGPQLDAVLN
ncbi:YdcF family protein [Dinoroseobacter sp. S124A]|uniref:YdcF family protein n=1 Tax=Dinoroseobacter sp. S124A TaxID=3415128 RepID=UPI003C7B4A40